MKYLIQKISRSIKERIKTFNKPADLVLKTKLEYHPNRNFANILITGGAGFIGSHLVKHLNSKFVNSNITVLDSLTNHGALENLDDEHAKYEFIYADISDRTAIFKSLEHKKYDAIIHLAAETRSGNSVKDTHKFIQTNIIGTVNILEYALFLYEKNPNFVFYHISTEEVFGSLELHTSKKFNEKTSYNPRSMYSASKASSDFFVRAYYYTHGLPILISNCSNNYGTHQGYDKLIPSIVKSLVNKEQIQLYGSGENIRDWLHIRDHVAAISTILTSGSIGETYCIGGNETMNNIQITEYICELFDEKYGYMNSASLIELVKDRKGHDLHYDINFEKIHQLLGWSPKIYLEDGLKETIDWYYKKFSKNVE